MKHKKEYNSNFWLALLTDVRSESTGSKSDKLMCVVENLTLYSSIETPYQYFTLSLQTFLKTLIFLAYQVL